MAVRWTKEQQKVIDTRDRDILVSAAAGSGKTAVLVERILSIITDEKKPVDIDRLLVVTFTNAAASEMRSRIRDALEARAQEDPDNIHLQRQLVLVHNAKITTIHSFCLHVLRNHFQAAGIDPSFRIADEGEVLLLEQEAVQETVNAAYERAEAAAEMETPPPGVGGRTHCSSENALRWSSAGETPDAEFPRFLERFATGKGDSEVEETVLRLYHFALGHPFPEEWLRQCREAYTSASRCEQDSTWGNQEHPAWLEFIETDTAMRLADIRGQVEEALRITREPDGPYPYEKALLSDLELVDALCGPNDRTEEGRAGGGSGRREYPAYALAFQEMSGFARLSPKKDEAISEDKKQQVQLLRAEYKEQLQGLKDQYYYDEIEVLKEEYAASGVTVRVLTVLAEELMARLAEKKAEKNVLDFGDLEHLALKALVKRKKAEQALSAEEDAEACGTSRDEGRARTLQDWEPTAVAQEYAETFEEIMIDEYQDSNLVQELILNSVSGKKQGAHNRFMVGDVKQSIYRFRLARPELFMEKYRTYRAAEAEAEKDGGNENGKPPAPPAACRIDLHRNFRSRHQVLDFVNLVFRRIMTEPLGGVAYDDDAALYPGADMPEAGSQADAWYETELLLMGGMETPPPEVGGRTHCSSENALRWSSAIETPPPGVGGRTHCSSENASRWSSAMEDASSAEAAQAASARKLRIEEARMAGRRIRELVGHMPVLDRQSGAFRPARYGDIVILLRTVSGWAEIFGEVLADMDIPCFTGSQQGYFSAAEIRVVLSYLQILDNPLQDIPLAAVLRSAIGNVTDEELAAIRLEGMRMETLRVEAVLWTGETENTETTETTAARQPYFYDLCRYYCRSGSNAGLRDKLEDFFQTYEMLREKCGYTPVHLLLWELLDVTGYGEYAAALPAGRQRRANLDMLVEKAISYEATSYRGLYHFVRYIEKLQKYEVDYGEANIGSEADNTVRLMSIHKSKGLEFPIVFVCGMGKAFNEADIRSRVVMHPDWGMACDCVDETMRTRQATLLKKMIQQKTVSENLGEELRVLYVAMTRAKEKLILTGSIKDVEKRLTVWDRVARRSAMETPPPGVGGKSHCSSENALRWSSAQAPSGDTLPYSWLLGASCYLDWVVPAMLSGADAFTRVSLETADGPHYGIRIFSPSDNAAEAHIDRMDAAVGLQELLCLDTDACSSPQAKAYLGQVFGLNRPHDASRALPGKVSVSELKKMSQCPDEQDAQELYEAEPVVPLLPRFRRRQHEAASGPGLLSGAARGTVYHTFMENLDFSKKEGLEYQLEELISCGKMSEDDAAALRLEDIRAFLRSDIGRRMEQAAQRGVLVREQPFVLGVPACELRGEWQAVDELVLVQGIIDAYFPMETPPPEVGGRSHCSTENGIVLLDYKTDRVSDGHILAERYRSQLDYYTAALERLTGKNVCDRVIYSFCLGCEIHV